MIDPGAHQRRNRPFACSSGASASTSPQWFLLLWDADRTGCRSGLGSLQSGQISRDDERRHPMRSLRPLVLAFVLAPVAVLAGAGAASAQPPERFAFTEEDPGVIDCGGFEDHFTDFFDVKGTTFVGA